MKILICGPDGSGKTTLANELSHELCLPVFKGSVQDHNKQRNLETLLFERDNFICDRCYALEDEVYSNLKIGKKSIDLTRDITNRIKENCIIVYLDADINTLYNRLSVRGDSFIATDRAFLAHLQYEYSKFFDKYGFKPIVFNNRETYEIVRELKEMILNESISFK